jgi:hypothetical protein
MTRLNKANKSKNCCRKDVSVFDRVHLRLLCHRWLTVLDLSPLQSQRDRLPNFDTDEPQSDNISLDLLQDARGRLTFFGFPSSNTDPP